MMRRTEFCCARARENTPHFNHPIHTTVEEDPKAELVEKKCCYLVELLYFAFNVTLTVVRRLFKIWHVYRRVTPS